MWAAKTGVNFRSSLMLGRQHLHCADWEIRAASRAFQLNEDPCETLRHGAPFAESVFSWLGATQVDSLDASDYESATKIHDLGCSLKVYRREITDEIRLYGEMHRFLVPLAEHQGARVTELEVGHRARTAGTSKYGLSRTVKVLLDLLTVWFFRRYQTKPIYVFGGAGFAMLGTSVALASYVLYQKLALDVWVHRNPLFSLAAFSALLGVQSLGMGLLAEIIVRTYFESQGRSPYPIAERLGFPAPKKKRARARGTEDEAPETDAPAEGS